MTTFAQPYFLLLLLPSAVAAWFVYRRRARTGVVYSAVGRIPASSATWRIHASRILPVLFITALALAVIALARPRKVFSRSSRTTDSIAIHMVVDVSGSMEALDLSDIEGNRIIVERSRLDVVKKTFAAFVEKRPDDLLGLITFGGYATTRTPLTTDHAAVMHVLSGVEIPRPAIGNNGRMLEPDELQTAIGDALATACARLKDIETKSKIIVLLSDGYSNTGIIQPKDAIKAAKELKIKVYTIGLGTNQAEVPVRVTDILGREVIRTQPMKFDEALLKEIAEATEGSYFSVKDPEGLEKAMENINKLEKTEIERDVYYQFTELFPWFLGPALALLVLGTGLNMLIARRLV